STISRSRRSGPPATSPFASPPFGTLPFGRGRLAKPPLAAGTTAPPGRRSLLVPRRRVVGQVGRIAEPLDGLAQARRAGEPRRPARPLAQPGGVAHQPHHLDRKT